MNNLKCDITYLNLEKDIIDSLREHNINSINDLWIKTRKNLKSMGFLDSQIKDIIIKLELLGIDLGKKQNK